MEAQVMANRCARALCTFQVVWMEGATSQRAFHRSSVNVSSERSVSKHHHYTKSFSTKPQAPCPCTLHSSVPVSRLSIRVLPVFLCLALRPPNACYSVELSPTRSRFVEWRGS